VCSFESKYFVFICVMHRVYHHINKQALNLNGKSNIKMIIDNLFTLSCIYD
jgi:hypothetical protein